LHGSQFRARSSRGIGHSTDDGTFFGGEAALPTAPTEGVDGRRRHRWESSWTSTPGSSG
jgi:hypothetical protein